MHHCGTDQVACVGGVNGEMRLAERAARQVEHHARASSDLDGLGNQRGRRQNKQERDQARTYRCRRHLCPML